MLIVSVLVFTLSAGSCLADTSAISPVNTNNPQHVVKVLEENLKKQDAQSRNFLELINDKKGLIELMERNLTDFSLGKNDGQCSFDLLTFFADIARTEPYAIRLVDAWGKLESGIFTGNKDWMGRYYECLSVHATNFSGKYFWLNIGPSATGLAIGSCFPDSCSDDDIHSLLLPLQNRLKQQITPHNPVQPTTYTAVDIAAITITCLLGIVVIVATCYELYINWKKESGAEYNRLDGTLEPATQSLSVFSNIVLSFSFIKNTKAILDTTQKEGNINSLHGLRFLSMSWVILGHTFIFGPVFIDNVVDAADIFISKGSFQAVGNATFSVDTFFFLSGLLATYLGLKEMQKRNGRLSVLLPYAYRYLRLTPAYAFCILISVSLYSKFGDGPAWPAVAEGFRKPCEQYWWTNLLYINNLHPTTLDEECFAWSWYLANDMQFFLLLPFLLYLMHRYPRIGVVTMNIGVLCSMIATGVISSHYKQQPMALEIGLSFHQVVKMANGGVGNLFTSEDYANGSTTSAPSTNGSTTFVPPTNESTTPFPTTPATPSEADLFWSDTYTKPWCRMGTYFIGVLAGLVLYSNNTRVRLNKIVVLLGWLVAFGTGLAIIYGLYNSIHTGENLDNNVAAFYNAVSRQLWAYCLMWLVIACSSGYGGPINAFLSWKAFIPLSRLTYCAYLVHPLVIYWAYGVLETKLHFSLQTISLLYAGLLGVSYTIAFTVSVLIEMPMLGITKALLGKSGKQKPIPAPINMNRELHDHSDKA